ncbi:unnamed protein product [Peronospora belbahrii]|uniref:Uncharacterized protein n=1 Tax=Peronospora belbahrii TaxID=622444 RepID=A0AAU9L0X2_9STRA|nr:unnamed protein product [Peronospora belbahrii]
MKLYHAISLVAVTAHASDARNFSFQGELNGWYSCPKYTFAINGTSDDHDAECAVFGAPFCYPGICTTECVNHHRHFCEANTCCKRPENCIKCLAAARHYGFIINFTGTSYGRITYKIGWSGERLYHGPTWIRSQYNAGLRRSALDRG